MHDMIRDKASECEAAKFHDSKSLKGGIELGRVEEANDVCSATDET